MLKLVVNAVLAGWLLVSAFVLPQSTVSAWNAIVVAVLVAAVALFAFVAVGRPGIRWGVSVLAVWLFASAIVLPHESLGTVLHDALVACLLALVSLLPSHRWGGQQAQQAVKPA